MEDEKSMDLDLYTDLLTSENEFAIKGEVQHKFDEQQQQIEVLKSRNDQLEKQNKILMRNISSLFKTAKLEITRKDRRIQELQENLDSLIFKRNRNYRVNHTDQSPIQKPTRRVERESINEPDDLYDFDLFPVAEISTTQVSQPLDVPCSSTSEVPSNNFLTKSKTSDSSDSFEEKSSERKNYSLSEIKKLQQQLSSSIINKYKMIKSEESQNVNEKEQKSSSTEGEIENKSTSDTDERNDKNVASSSIALNVDNEIIIPDKTRLLTYWRNKEQTCNQPLDNKNDKTKSEIKSKNKTVCRQQNKNQTNSPIQSIKKEFKRDHRKDSGKSELSPLKNTGTKKSLPTNKQEKDSSRKTSHSKNDKRRDSGFKHSRHEVIHKRKHEKDVKYKTSLHSSYKMSSKHFFDPNIERKAELSEYDYKARKCKLESEDGKLGTENSPDLSKKTEHLIKHAPQKELINDNCQEMTEHNSEKKKTDMDHRLSSNSSSDYQNCEVENLFCISMQVDQDTGFEDVSKCRLKDNNQDSFDYKMNLNYEKTVLQHPDIRNGHARDHKLNKYDVNKTSKTVHRRSHGSSDHHLKQSETKESTKDRKRKLYPMSPDRVNSGENSKAKSETSAIESKTTKTDRSELKDDKSTKDKLSDIEEGEILSDDDDSWDRSKRCKRTNCDRQIQESCLERRRKMDRVEYLKQLEENKKKMEIRRKNVLLAKAKERRKTS